MALDGRGTLAADYSRGSQDQDSEVSDMKQIIIKAIADGISGGAILQGLLILLRNFALLRDFDGSWNRLQGAR
jgi:hypothetical protein